MAILVFIVSADPAAMDEIRSGVRLKEKPRRDSQRHFTGKMCKLLSFVFSFEIDVSTAGLLPLVQVCVCVCVYKHTHI